MKIAVVTRMLRKDKLEGFGVFTHELLSRMVRQHPGHEFQFLFDRPYDAEFLYEKNVRPFILGPPARHPLLLAYWYQVRLNSFLKRHRPDVLVSPDGGIPLPSPVPTVAIIHDLNFEHFPADMPFFTRWYYRRYYKQIAHRSTRLVTVSEFSKSDLSKTYAVDPEKIDVVYNGVGNQFQPLPLQEMEAVRKQYASGSPYFLFVGSIHKRKNLPNMIRAFSLFRKETSSQTRFIIAGARRWWDEEMDKALAESAVRSDILFPGRIPDDELPRLTASAEALIFASRFEGFGIPIIEAMKCGVPVITSNVSSMPEIAGTAGVLVNPESVDEIASAMKKIHLDGPYREELIQKGLERSKTFNWDVSAEKLAEIIFKAGRS